MLARSEAWTSQLREAGWCMWQWQKETLLFHGILERGRECCGYVHMYFVLLHKRHHERGAYQHSYI